MLPSILIRRTPTLFRRTLQVAGCSSSDKDFSAPAASVSSSDPRPETSGNLPIEPAAGSCCGQGCANCVWIEYGNQLIDYYSAQGKEKTMNEIAKKVEDPNIKAYVISELALKWKKQQ